MAINIEVGQWYRSNIGLNVKCIYIDKTQPSKRYVLAFPDGSVSHHTSWAVNEHLPDCTGFDWEPPKRPEPPPGWRWLSDDEVTVEGDRYWAKHCNTFDPEYALYIRSNLGKAWRDMHDGVHETCRGILRKIDPKYRPFKNAEEFAPHRDRWVRYKQSDVGKTMLCVSFSEEGVRACVSFMPYKNAFDSLIFEDGTPFGVLDDQN